MSNKSQIRAAFDQAALTYDAAAVLQREVVDRMAEKLAIVKLDARTVLDAGCGTGYAAKMLQACFPQAQLLQLDLAHGMLCAARGQQATGVQRLWGRLKGESYPMQLGGDIEALPLADASVDVIWSSLTLQWCETPDAAFAEAMRVLRPGGLLMFSTLGPDTLNELRSAFAAADDHSHVNRFIDMHDLGDALGKHYFGGIVVEMERIVMTYHSVREVLADLKGIGAQSLRDGRRSGMMGKSAWQKMLAAYEQFRSHDVLPATYEVIYGHAWKPETAPAKTLADGRQVIEFVPHPRPNPPLEGEGSAKK